MKPGWHTDRGDYKLFLFRCPPQETFHPTSIVPMTGAATMASHGLKTISSTSSTFLPTGPGKIVGQWVNTCFQWANAAMGSSSAQGDRNRPLQMSSTWVRVLLTLAKLRPVGVISCLSFSCISTHMFTLFWLLVKWEYCTGKWMLRLHLWIYFSILMKLSRILKGPSINAHWDGLMLKNTSKYDWYWSAFHFQPRNTTIEVEEFIFQGLESQSG